MDKTWHIVSAQEVQGQYLSHQEVVPLSGAYGEEENKRGQEGNDTLQLDLNSPAGRGGPV